MAIKGWKVESLQIIGDYAKWFVLYRLVIVTVGDVARLRRWCSSARLVTLFAVEGIQHTVSPIAWVGPAVIRLGGWAAAEIGPTSVRWISIFDGPGVFCVAYTIALPFALSTRALRRGGQGSSTTLVPLLLCNLLHRRARRSHRDRHHRTFSWL